MNPNITNGPNVDNREFEAEERLAELERVAHTIGNRRPATAGQFTPNPSIPPIPLPPQPIAANATSATPLGLAGLNPAFISQVNGTWGIGGPPPNLSFFNPNNTANIPRGNGVPLSYQPPPPPYIDRDDIFKDFSCVSPQEYAAQENRLYQRINYHAKVRLGYGRTISVLQRELENQPTYSQVIRPYQIDQPENLPLLSPLIPNSEARLFADTIRALIDIIGLQRSLQALEAAKPHDVPGIKYEVQRVRIPSRATPIPLEPPSDSNSAPPKTPEVGPYARGRVNSAASTASSLVTSFSWPTQQPRSTGASMDDLPPPLTTRPSSPKRAATVDLIRAPSPVAPLAPQRGILRRSASGSLLTGKRVTIETGSTSNPPTGGQMSTTSTFEAPTPVMSPGPMSPTLMDRDLSLQLQALNLSTDGPNRASQTVNGSRSPRSAEEQVLMQMAAAQM